MAILMSFKAAATESSDCGCCCSGSEPDPRIQNDFTIITGIVVLFWMHDFRSI